jgi:hypothetical protein
VQGTSISARKLTGRGFSRTGGAEQRMTKVLASQKFQGHARRFEDFGLKHKLAVFVRGQTRLNKRVHNLDSTHQLAGYARHVVDKRPPLVPKP